MNVNIEDIALQISKNTLYDYYKCHTKNDTAQYFNLRKCVLNKLLDYYNIVKTPEDVKLTRETTCLTRFGATNAFASPEKIKKIQSTNLQKYGAANPFASDQIKDKIKHTNIQRYGVEYVTQNINIKLKTKQTLLEKYGDENYVNVEKCKETKLNKYGDSTYNNKNKIAQTCLSKYGVTSALKSDEVKNKIKKFYQLKYNVDYAFQVPEIQNKIKDTMNHKYGCNYYTQTEEFRQHMSNIYHQKVVETGTCTINQDKLPDNFRVLLYDRNKSIDFLENNKYTISQLSNLFECSATAIVHWIKRLDLSKYIQYNTGSRYEDELYSLLKDYGFVQHQKVLDGKEIDLYNEKLKIGIEFNGDYWHCDINKPRKYHEDKSKLAEQLGIHLIHIYEYEWNNPRIKSILLSMINIAIGNVNTRIYARNCQIKQISNKEARDFNNKNHLQGHRNAQITYGLFYKDELVQLMSFSKHSKYEWEIIRGCPGSNNIVVGGVSKLFSYFIKENNPTQIFSYCDFNKFTGVGYEKLGMKFIGYTGPDKKYIIDGKVYNRQPKRYKEFKEKAEAVIWGAGSKKYLWTKEQLNGK